MTVRSIDPTARETWRRLRGPLAIVLVLVIGGAVFAVLQSGTTGGPLDPRSARQAGGRALAVLLEERGVEVQRARTLAEAVEYAAQDATLLVTEPDLLVPSQLTRLAAAPTRHLVLFNPGEEVLFTLAPKVTIAGEALARTRSPGCDLEAAVRAGAVRADGPMYRILSGTPATTCYGDGTRGALVRLTAAAAPDSPSGQTAGGQARRTIDVVGVATSFANNQLENEGHAALALNLLGEQRRLVWYIPSLADVPLAGTPGGEEPTSPFALLPDGIRFGVGQLAVAAALLMLAYARRLGPVVPESLPVVVRASEAVEGLARLYHRARARNRAASALRDATRARLSSLLGLPPHAPDSAVVAATTARTGRTSTDVSELLTGGDVGTGPSDDAALVRLADDLDTLEQEVRRS
ncbi:DUF4350 domain-containing protein [Actinopolymorpha alba]|uniref:DUF4350 domain-containing protein n=1 Tax=Actinopolymorpha alba TaxID=533267 RepID=UPI00036636C7|nr:DUF4350 domain-containing protein [Actinopolymorpha alba]